MHVEQPAEGGGLGVAQLRELRGDVLHRAVVLAELHAHAVLGGGRGVAVARERLVEYPAAAIHHDRRGATRLVEQPLRQWAETLLDESLLRSQGMFQPAPVRRIWRDHIEGRRKNVLITSFGRNVSPEWPEAELLAGELGHDAAWQHEQVRQYQERKRQIQDLDRNEDMTPARAVPAWVSSEMELPPEYLRQIQREPSLWLRARPDSLQTTNAYRQRLRLYRGEIGPEAVLTPADTEDVQAAVDQAVEQADEVVDVGHVEPRRGLVED